MDVYTRIRRNTNGLIGILFLLFLFTIFTSCIHPTKPNKVDTPQKMEVIKGKLLRLEMVSYPKKFCLRFYMATCTKTKGVCYVKKGEHCCEKKDKGCDSFINESYDQISKNRKVRPNITIEGYKEGKTFNVKNFSVYYNNKEDNR